MFVILERPTERDKCEFVNEFGQLYVNAGEEYVWSKYVLFPHFCFFGNLNLFHRYGRNLSEMDNMDDNQDIVLSLKHYRKLINNNKLYTTTLNLLTKRVGARELTVCGLTFRDS